MQCPYCGNNVPFSTQSCPSCGACIQQQQNFANRQNFYGQQPAAVKTFLVESILVTLFCCLPFGIVAIVFASKANSALGQGDYAGAQAAAATAKTWTIISFIFGLLWSILYTIFLVLEEM